MSYTVATDPSFLHRHVNHFLCLTSAHSQSLVGLSTIRAVCLIIAVTKYSMKVTREGGFLLACGSRGYSASWQERHGSRGGGSWPRGILSQEAEKRDCRCDQLVFSYQSRTPAPGKAPPTFKLGFLVSIDLFYSVPHRLTHRSVSMVILNSITLIIKD